MWIECIRIRWPRARQATSFGRRTRRGERRNPAASLPPSRLGNNELLIAAICQGLEARGLLQPDDSPSRLRRRVGYVVRDALAACRREGSSKHET